MGLESPWGLDHPVQQKHLESMFHWNTIQANKHVALNTFSSFLDIWYEEVANVVWLAIDFYYSFREENWKGKSSSVATTGCNMSAPATWPNHGWNRQFTTSQHLLLANINWSEEAKQFLRQPFPQKQVVSPQISTYIFNYCCVLFVLMLCQQSSAKSWDTIMVCAVQSMS